MESTVETTGAITVTEDGITTTEVAGVSEEESESQPIEEDAEGNGGEVTEGEEEKPKKLTANERIQQLVAEKNALKDELSQTASRIQALEERFQAKTEQQTPDYLEITPEVTERINDALANLRQQQAVAEQNGNYLAAVAAQREIEAIYNGLVENESRVQAARVKAQEAQKGTQIAKALDDRAEFYRQSQNIPADVWQEGGNWFAKQCEGDAILRQKFVDLVQFGSPMAAIEFAAKYTQENMTAQVASSKQKREEAKGKIPTGGSNSSTGKQELSDDLPYKEWVRLRNEQLKRR